MVPELTSESGALQPRSLYGASGLWISGTWYSVIQPTLSMHENKSTNVTNPNHKQQLHTRCHHLATSTKHNMVWYPTGAATWQTG